MGDDDWNLALPPFKVGEALVQLKRSLRDLKLAERADGFEFKARRVIELHPEPDHIAARLAKRPALAPEWESRALKSGADVRKFVDEVRRRLPRWDHDD